MNKRWKVWLLIFLAAVAAIAVISAQMHKPDELPEGYYSVFVNDKAMNWFTKRSVDKVLLPFLALTESVGISADWQSDTVAHLSFADRTWVFDLSDGSLKQLGTNSDVLFPPPGSMGGKRMEAVERDVYIDTISLGLFLREYMGARIDEIDEAQRVVRITHISKKN